VSGKGQMQEQQVISFVLMLVIGIIAALVIWKVVEVMKPSGSPMNTPSGPTCGNGKVEAGEECDDGNKAGGDGCGATCRTENQSPAPGWGS